MRYFTIVTFTLSLMLIGITKTQGMHIECRGWYITLKGDTVKASFMIPFTLISDRPDFSSMTRRVKCKGLNGQKFKLYAKDAKELYVVIEGIAYKMRSVFNNDLIGSVFNSNKQIFLQVLTNGKLSLLGYEYLDVFMGVATSKMTMVLQRSDGKILKVSNLGFSSFVSNFLSDCPYMSKRIKNKQYDLSNIDVLVSDYNEGCN